MDKFNEFSEKRISEKDIYQGSVIKVKSLEVKLPNGSISKRDLVMHPGASVVIPLNNEGELYMVSQYRTPLQKMSLEIPAGKLDYGEDPLVCARRELHEETGVTAEKIEFLMAVHATPGFCDEKLHLYLATGLTEGEPHTDEDEFLSCEKMKVDDLIKMIKNGEISDSKTIIGILIADKFLKGQW